MDEPKFVFRVIATIGSLVAVTIISVAAIIATGNYYSWKVIVDGGYEQHYEPVQYQYVWRKSDQAAERQQ